MHKLSFLKGDKSELIKLVERINTLQGDLYIKSTWDVLQGVLAEANGVINDVNAMEEEVSQIYDKLLRAELNLRLKPNKDILEELIKDAENRDSNKYTEESWRSVSDALAKAKEVYGNEEATIEEVKNSEKALRNALDNLIAKNNEGNNGGSSNNGMIK